MTLMLGRLMRRRPWSRREAPSCSTEEGEEEEEEEEERRSTEISPRGHPKTQVTPHDRWRKEIGKGEED